MCVHTLITVAHVQVRRQLTGIHSVLRHVGPEAQIISLGGKHLSLLDHPPPSPILPFHTLNHTESCHGEADLSWGSQHCIGEMGQLNLPHLAWRVLPLPGNNPQNQQYKCAPRQIT